MIDEIQAILFYPRFNVGLLYATSEGYKGTDRPEGNDAGASSTNGYPLRRRLAFTTQKRGYSHEGGQ